MLLIADVHGEYERSVHFGSSINFEGIRAEEHVSRLLQGHLAALGTRVSRPITRPAQA